MSPRRLSASVRKKWVAASTRRSGRLSGDEWEVKKHNTYEPIKNLAGCEDMIAEYKERKRQRESELEAEEREKKRQKQEEAEAERKQKAGSGGWGGKGG